MYVSPTSLVFSDPTQWKTPHNLFFCVCVCVVGWLVGCCLKRVPPPSASACPVCLCLALSLSLLASFRRSTFSHSSESVSVSPRDPELTLASFTKYTMRHFLSLLTPFPLTPSPLSPLLKVWPSGAGMLCCSCSCCCKCNTHQPVMQEQRKRKRKKWVLSVFPAIPRCPQPLPLSWQTRERQSANRTIFLRQNAEVCKIKRERQGGAAGKSEGWKVNELEKGKEKC